MFIKYKYLSHVSLLHDSRKDDVFSSGVCIPFSKNVFVTAKGLIMPCERISHTFAMGRIDGNRVCIDFAKAAKIFNDCISQRMHTCKYCYKSLNCMECIFVLDSQRCPKFSNKEIFTSYISTQIYKYEK